MSRRLPVWLAGGALFGLVGLLALAAFLGGEPACDVPGALTEPGNRYVGPPTRVIDTDRVFEAVIETSLGTIRADLFGPLAPDTVNNFVFLAREGFFDGTTLHRVEVTDDHAIVQGGDPTGTGCGGPGYTYDGEVPSPITPYRRGVVAMVNAGTPASNGSQFFIVIEDYEALQQPTSMPRYTAFGLVEDAASLAVLDAVAAAPRKGTRPDPPIVVRRVRITRGPRVT